MNTLGGQGTGHSGTRGREGRPVLASCRLAAWTPGVRWGRTVLAGRPEGLLWKSACQHLAATAARGTHPEPSERGIIFASLLSDTDAHAGKRKHLLSDAAATSSSEGSSQCFTLQNEGADGRPACVCPGFQSASGPRRERGPRLPLWVTGDFL